MSITLFLKVLYQVFGERRLGSAEASPNDLENWKLGPIFIASRKTLRGASHQNNQPGSFRWQVSHQSYCYLVGLNWSSIPRKWGSKDSLKSDLTFICPGLRIRSHLIVTLRVFIVHRSRMHLYPGHQSCHGYTFLVTPQYIYYSRRLESGFYSMHCFG